MAKILKDSKEYERALSEIENLISLDPDANTPERERIDLLAILIEDYENRRFPADLPDPIEAIKFRMGQQGLAYRDLIPYIGSRSKVSEILSGKRPLTLRMIRALHFGLGIPAQVLLQEHNAAHLEETSISWEKFPLKEMISRGWIEGQMADIRERAEDLLLEFFSPLDPMISVKALLRSTENVRSARKMDVNALTAWAARIIILALENPPSNRYEPSTINLEFMRRVVKLSHSDEGPLLAREYLQNHGIALIIEPHLPRTYLDGAAIMLDSGLRIIGLTLRHDRIDNFWFTLMHELAHIALHVNEETQQLYDDLDVIDDDDYREKEADELSGEALIPKNIWLKSPASRLRSPEAAEHLAKQLGIHPAIVAGRMRHEFKAYRLLNNLVGHRQVRCHFSNILWEGK